MANSSLLLVEGRSEVNVIKKLCPLCGIDIQFETKSENSLSELKDSLKIHLKSTNIYKKIWVIIDADINFEGAWQSIRDILIRSRKYAINPQQTLPLEGIVINPIDANDIVVGVWIMPNNTDVGMLEDFLIGLIPENDTLHTQAVSIVDALEQSREQHLKLYKTVHKSKAEIYTWLSWHDTPGESLGVAVEKRLFETDADLCKKFYNWLNQLNF